MGEARYGRGIVWEGHNVGVAQCGRSRVWEEHGVGGHGVGGARCGRGTAWEGHGVGGAECVRARTRRTLSAQGVPGTYFLGQPQACHISPLPHCFSLGSLPNPKPGNLVILIMKRKHVLFKILAAEFSAMLFLCDSRISFAFWKS